MYWPSGPLESATTSPCVAYSMPEATGAEQARVGVPSMSLWSCSSAGSSPYETSELLLKSSVAFTPLHQQQSAMEQVCFLHSSAAGRVHPQNPFGTVEYPTCTLGADSRWTAAPMVPAVGRTGRYQESGVDSADRDASSAMDLSKATKRRTGGRRPKEECSELSPEEEEKRRLRRLRNKEAAARCRRRRLEHMCRLESEVEDLLAQREQLQEEVEALHREKFELEMILESHLPHCRLPGGGGGESSSDDGLLAAGVATTSYSSDDTNTTLSIQSVEQGSNKSSGSNSPTEGFLARPKSLGIIRFGTTPDMPMETPSKIFLFDPLRIPTGMTPVTHKEVDPIISATSGYMQCRVDDGDDRPSPPSTSSPPTSKALVTL
uniref:BZIP domain-containing protein n=1 Tax=Trichuris muris TaxID=70415 RepID=A0A5S6QZ95_TRIMR